MSSPRPGGTLSSLGVYSSDLTIPLDAFTAGLGDNKTITATGKWRRATLSQVQLSSYFTGFTEIYEFREEYRAQQGAGFNLRDFHNQFLSFGNAPVKYIRELMQQ